MKKLKMFLPICLLALALSLCLSACNDSRSTTPPQTTPPQTTPAPQEIVIDGEYVILSGSRATVASADVFDVFDAVRMLTGKNVAMKNDSSAAAAKEIIVGDTSRPESADARALIESLTESSDTGVWVILAVGEKLVVTGNNPDATKMAIDHLLANYFTSERGAKFPENLCKTGTYSISGRQQELDRLEAERLEREYAEKMADIKAALDKLPATIGSTQTISHSYPTPSVRPTANQHPRVMVSDDMIPELLEELEHENAIEAKQALLEYVAKDPVQYDYGVLANNSDNWDWAAMAYIEANAYYYLLTGDELYGYRAIVLIQNFINTVAIDNSLAYREYGYTMMVAGEVYDWCYDLLTAQDKTRIINGVLTNVAPGLEIGFPPKSQGAVVGHGSEAQLLRDYFTFAIAVADECPELYDCVMGRIESQYVPVRNYYYQSGMYMAQGNTYSMYRYQFDVTAQHLYRVMTGGASLFEGDMAAVGRTFIYNLRPDNSLLRLGDDTGERSDSYTMSSYRTLLYWVGYVCSDPISLSEATRLGGYSAFVNNDQSLSVVQFLCIFDPDLEPSSREELPLAVYNGSPVGQIIAHSKWSGVDAVLLYMKIGETYTANHEHKDVGQFQIYYKGILASDAGFYEGYGGEMHNYTRSSLAHNTLLIYDPNEDVGSGFNVGGQISRDDGESTTLASWLNKWNTTRATVIGHEIAYHTDNTLDYTYIAGDITEAYAPEKADEVLRYMYGVFTGDAETPLVFFVFDKITASDPSLKKTFLLQCEREPLQSGDLTILRSKNGGMLVNRTLPLGSKDVSIEVVEGAYKLLDGTTAESNRPEANHDSLSLEKGWGRIEISPELGNRTDYMLNVMYVADDNTAGASPTYAEAIAYENSSVAGASILGYAVFFSKTVDRLSYRFEIEGSGEGEIGYSIAGVVAGEWSVYASDGSLVCTATASEEGGLLHFKAPAGSYTLVAPGDSLADHPGDGVYPDPYAVSAN